MAKVGPNRRLLATAVGFSLLILVVDFGAFLSFETVSDPISVEVSEGQSLDQLTLGLKQRGVLRGSFSLSAYLAARRLTGRNLTVEPGGYQLPANRSSRAVLVYLFNPKNREIKILIPEGFRREQIAARLESLGLAQARDFLEATLYQVESWPELEKFKLVPGQTLEGFLFPATYEFRRGLSAREIARKMVETFLARTDDLDFRYPDLTLASIVEREAKNQDERKAIAGIYLRRLSLNMLLQADPTVQYARDTRGSKDSDLINFRFWQPIKPGEIGLNSKFNTYREVGLPPTPIANPGLESLKAAITPEETGDRFFFHDREDRLQRSSSAREHDRKKALFGVSGG